ncbi:hypothetical protein BK123_33830 [Paenibacillus lautus]|uniref:Uncharacterized protein n=1 Tax=Paenibacillus lautus TaxID=1401 RepID=A0A1R1AFB2_PAELA|nr:hypothetical protein BK123_33830 [Paenibacillus lautus]
MSHTYTLSQQNHWNNRFEEWKLPLYYPESFLSPRNWNTSDLKRTIQRVAFQQIKACAQRDYNPIFVILDDSVCVAFVTGYTHAIQGTSFQHSHLKGQHVYS